MSFTAPEPVRNSLELDLGVAEQVAERGLILRTLVGSEVYGLSQPGVGDIDMMGVCVEPPVYMVGSRRFDHFSFRSQPEGWPSQPGDVEGIVHGLKKFCKLAQRGSPTVLTPLFVPDGEHLLHITPLGRDLRALVPAFVSQAAGSSFMGYLDGQRRGLLGQRHATVRDREVGPTGYDTKFAMHALRIGYQGVEFLTDGTMRLPVAEPLRSHLMDVRAGKLALQEVLDELDEVAEQLNQVRQSADLPESPDYARVNRFLAEAYQRAWSGELDLPEIY
jgi:hypothetical protein